MTGAAPVPVPPPIPRVTPIPSWILRAAADNDSACASVLVAMNSHPAMFERTILLTALPPAPPTPTTVIRGFSSCSSFGMLRLIILSPFTPLRLCSCPARPPPDLYGSGGGGLVCDHASL